MHPNRRDFIKSGFATAAVLIRGNTLNAQSPLAAAASPLFLDWVSVDADRKSRQTCDIPAARSRTARATSQGCQGWWRLDGRPPARGSSLR